MNYRRGALGAATVCVASLVATSSAATDGPNVQGHPLFAQAEGHAAVLNDDTRSNLIAGGFGYALRVGWRWDHLGVFAQGGQDAWFATGIRRNFDPGVLNLGLGAEFRYFDERVRSSVAGGTSTLLFDTPLDDAGTTGWFANLRPAGFRWSLTDHVALELHPVSFMIMQPVTKQERLTKVEYQTVLALEIN